MEPVPYAKLGDLQSLNLYAYVGNNPLDGVDADGHYGPEFAIPDSSWVSDDPGTQEQKAKEAAARQQAQRQQAQQKGDNAKERAVLGAEATGNLATAVVKFNA